MNKFLAIIVIFIGFLPMMLMAQSAPDVFTHKFGAVEASMLSEGQDAGNSSIFIGATPEMIQKSVPDGSYPRSCNAFLVRMNGKNILVDAAFGRKLFDNLKSLGVAPEQIDVVLLTHLHGDHIGGMIRDGQVAFPNAEVYMSKYEYDYWMSDAARNPNNARNVLERYRKQLRLIFPDEIGAPPLVLFPGISAIAAYGHTPGHTLYMFASGNDKLLVWGDLTHAMAIQMPFPQVAMTFDVNPEKAVETRKKVLEYVAENNIIVGGIHTAFPGMGRLTKKPEGGYLHVPVK